MIKSAIEAGLILVAICVLYLAVGHAGELQRIGPSTFVVHIGAKPQTFATPAGITCDTVKSYYAMLGGMAGIKAYAKQHNMTLTPRQQIAALACLRKS